ncbi:MAG: choice-of-anchor D domain-containing protein, partial [Egibacteraceae bacterium]
MVGDVHANIVVEGDISGQVAVGSNIYQMRVDHVHGDLVTIVRQDERPRVERRAAPVRLLPRKFSDFLDRELETRRAIAAVAGGEPIEFHGPSGVGKSSLLRHLAHHPQVIAEGGVLHLPARRQAAEDLLQALFGAFYECDTPYKPNGGVLRHYLQSADAVVLLDDVELGREEIEEVLDFVPSCRFVGTSSARRLVGPYQSVRLPGLPEDDALALIARGLGRSLVRGEQAAARRLGQAVEGCPLRLLHAVALVSSGERSLESVAEEFAVLASDAVGLMPERDRKLLAVLAVVPGLLLNAEQAYALTGFRQAQNALEELTRLGLAQAHPAVESLTRYGVPDEVGRTIREAWDLDAAGREVREYFLDWTRQPLSAPERSLQDVEAAREVMDWAKDAGRWADTQALGLAAEGTFALQGRWEAWRFTLETVLDSAQALGDRAAEAFALHQLGTRALCLGERDVAGSLLRQALSLREALGDDQGAAFTRHNLNLLMPPAVPLQGSQRGHTMAGRPLRRSAGILLLIIALGVLAWLALRPDPDFGPDSVSFGEQAMLTSSPAQTIPVRSRNGQQIDMEAVRIEGPGASDFSIVGTTCRRTGPAADDACSITIRFIPTTSGPREATLIVATGDEPVTVPLDGTGAAAPPGFPELTPPSLDFGEQPLGVVSTPQTLTLTNRGTSRLEVDDVTIAGAHASDFTLIRNTCTNATLAANASCTTAVSFAASAGGLRNAVMSTRLSGTEPDPTVTLIGFGRVAERPGVAPETAPPVTEPATEPPTPEPATEPPTPEPATEPPTPEP